MHIVARINLPKSANVSSLYIQCNESASINFPEGEIVLYQGGIVSSNSYFNSFYEKFYAKYTDLDFLYYLLKLEGDFQVSVYREVYGSNNRELISIDKFEKCQSSEHVKILLPNLLQNETSQGRIYFETECLSERGLFKEGLIATDKNKLREVSLGIVTCTYKKESYIKNTVNNILQDKFLQDKTFKMFVVDNGRTLNGKDFKNSKVQLIPNKNVGGSGGFTRGLVEALQSNSYSHLICMDDDIELDSECIYRLFLLYEYAKLDFAVTGTMLDLYEKHMVYEAGATYGKEPNSMKFAPFSLACLKNNLNLQNATSLNLLLLEEHIDYGGFWFFAFPIKFIEEIGLPMPFFIKVDDIEFGLRITEHFGSKIVAFPSIAVWHEPFYAKCPEWESYYYYRNDFITHAIHSSLSYINTIKHITKNLFFHILFFDYTSAELLLKAFEDYVKGPVFIKTTDPEILHQNIVKLSKSYKTQNIQQGYVPHHSNKFSDTPKAGILKKVASLLTLNGHLLPNFITSDDEVFIWQGLGYPALRSKPLAKKRVLVFNEPMKRLYQNEIDKLAGIKLLSRWLKVAAISSMRWSSITAEWKTASTELTSTNFWQQYFGIKK